MGMVAEGTVAAGGEMWGWMLRALGRWTPGLWTPLGHSDPSPQPMGWADPKERVWVHAWGVAVTFATSPGSPLALSHLR